MKSRIRQLKAFFESQSEYVKNVLFKQKIIVMEVNLFYGKIFSFQSSQFGKPFKNSYQKVGGGQKRTDTFFDYMVLFIDSPQF